MYLRRLVPRLMVAAVAMVSGACGSARPSSSSGPAPTASDSVDIGYGRESRARLTSAVASLSGEDLAHQRVSRVEELIRGRLAGVEVIRLPDGDFTLRIRRAASFTGDSEPLYVIDGMPVPNVRSFGNALIGIAPMDIERIDILKDAGAAAAYGSRGANGVVLITTRRR